MQRQKNQNSQNNVLIKKKVGRICTIYYKATVRVQYWWRDKHTDQWNRIERPDIDPPKYGQLIFDKGTRQFNGEWIVFSTNGIAAIGHPYVKKVNLNINLILYKNELKVDLHPNIKCMPWLVWLSGLKAIL